MDGPHGRDQTTGADAPFSARPPSSAPPPPPGSPAGRVRRWPWAMVSLVALVLALGAGAMAYEQRGVAAEWRERAESLQAQRDAGLEREQLVIGQRDELAALLARSEDDVAGLEDRLRALADEKAQAEDTATTVEVERDVFSELTGRIVAAVDALDGCVEQLFELQTASVEAFNRSTSGEPVDVVPLNATAQRVTGICNEARNTAANAGAAADGLLAP